MYAVAAPWVRNDQSVAAPHSRCKSAVLKKHSGKEPKTTRINVVETQIHLVERRTSAADNHSNHSVCIPTSVCACRVPLAAKESLLGFYGDLTATALRPYQNAERLCLLCLLKVPAVAWRSLRSQRVHWQCHCDTAAMFAIVLRTLRRSAVFLV